MAIRLERLEQSRPVPTPPRTYALSRLTDDQLERLETLTKRMTVGGVDALSPDEIMETADLMDIIEARDGA